MNAILRPPIEQLLVRLFVLNILKMLFDPLWKRLFAFDQNGTHLTIFLHLLLSLLQLTTVIMLIDSIMLPLANIDPIVIIV